MDQLPVDDGGQPVGVDDEVAEPKIPVDDRRRGGGGGGWSASHSVGLLEHRAGVVDALVHLPDPAERIRLLQARNLLWLQGMQAGHELAEVGHQHLARGRKVSSRRIRRAIVSPGTQRMTQTGGAQQGAVVVRKHLGDAQSRPSRRRAWRRPRGASPPGPSTAAGWVAAQDELMAVGAESPGLAGRAARQPAQRGDR